jgi:hypothetical protein
MMPPCTSATAKKEPHGGSVFRKKNARAMVKTDSPNKGEGAGEERAFQEKRPGGGDEG